MGVFFFLHTHKFKAKWEITEGKEQPFHPTQVHTCCKPCFPESKLPLKSMGIM